MSTINLADLEDYETHDIAMAVHGLLSLACHLSNASETDAGQQALCTEFDGLVQIQRALTLLILSLADQRKVSVQ